MPSKKRGPHPQDKSLFAESEWHDLRRAVRDYSWLKSRDYPEKAAGKLVGDRYALKARQRIAVNRSACSDDELLIRNVKELPVEKVIGCEFHIDGFNLLTTIEAVFGGGVLLKGRDGCVRDMSSMHGNYRVLSDTREALTAIHTALDALNPSGVIWYLDRPVSNSGRLRKLIEEISLDYSGFKTEVQLVADPDPILKELRGNDPITITADSGILNSCGFWFNLTVRIIEQTYPDSLILNFQDNEEA